MYYDHLRDNELIYSLMVHCGIWGLRCTPPGSRTQWAPAGWSTLFRGLIGAPPGRLLGAVIYELGGGLLFPQAMTDRPISVTPETRLMARLLVTVMAAVGIVLTADSGGGPRGPYLISVVLRSLTREDHEEVALAGDHRARRCDGRPGVGRCAGTGGAAIPFEARSGAARDRRAAVWTGTQAVDRARSPTG